MTLGRAETSRSRDPIHRRGPFPLPPYLTAPWGLGVLSVFLCLISPAWGKSSSPWSGDVGLGLSSTTGTNTSLSVNTKDDLRWKGPLWHSHTHLSFNYASSSGAVSANRLVVANQTKRLLSPSEYLYGNIRYDRNPFDGYYYHLSETLGYGQTIALGHRMTLSAEIGAGTLEDHPIGQSARVHYLSRLAGNYRWHISKHVVFKEDLTALVSSSGTNSYESNTSLQTRVYGPIGMQMSYTATYNTQVPAGYQRLNTITAVNLVYSF